MEGISDEGKGFGVEPDFEESISSGASEEVLKTN